MLKLVGLAQLLHIQSIPSTDVCDANATSYPVQGFP